MIDLMKVTGTDGKEYRVPVAAVDAIVARNRRHTDAAPLRKALERTWMLLDRGASREQAIGVIADALGLNELPRGSE